MKKSLLVLLVASSVSASVMAADGTITFNGEITDTTCNVTTASKNLTVDLPTVSTTALAAAGSTAGNTSFTLDLQNCSVNGVNVAANFESLSNGDATNGNINPTQAPAGVQIRLADATGTQAKVNGQPVGAKQITDGAAQLEYQAFYFAKTPVTNAGQVVAQVNYTLVYP